MLTSEIKKIDKELTVVPQPIFLYKVVSSSTLITFVTPEPSCRSEEVSKCSDGEVMHATFTL